MVATRRKIHDSAPKNAMETDLAQIPRIQERQKDYFDSGVTRALKWRQEQLNALHKMIKDNEQDWKNALFSDLGKSNIEV